MSKPPTAAHRHVPIRVAEGSLELGERFSALAEPQLVHTGDGRACTICKEPTSWRRGTSVKGAATHPGTGCESGYFDEVSPDVLADIEWSLVEAFGITEPSRGGFLPATAHREEGPAPGQPGRRMRGLRPGLCRALAGLGGVALR